MTNREQEEFLKDLFKYSERQALAGRFISHLLLGVKKSPIDFHCEQRDFFDKELR